MTAVVLKDFPPDYTFDKQNQPTGFAIEALEKVAALAGLRVRYLVKDNWGEVLEALLSGQADLCPFLAATAERQGKLDFTSPLATVQVGLVVRKTTQGIAGLSDLGQRRVGVITQSAAWEILRPRTDITLLPIEKTGDALFQLLTGQVDALAVPEQVILAMARKAGVEDRIKIVGEPLLEFARTMAVRKGSSDLFERLEPAVRSFVASPEYHQNYIRWYGVPPAYWTPARIVWAMSGLLLACLLAMALWRYLTITRLNRQLLATMAERQEAERKVAELAAIVASSEESIVSMDLNGVITSWNRGAEHLYGYSAEEALGEHISMLIPPGHHDQGLEYLHKARAGEKVEQYETVRRTKDGRLLDLSITLSPLLDKLGQQVGISAIARDIAERKRAEKALRESEEKLFMAFKHAPVMTAIAALEDGTFIDVNDKFLEVSGFIREEVLGRTATDVGWLRPEDRQRLMAALQRQGKVSDIEFTSYAKDGRPIHCLYNCELVNIGGVTRLLTMALDITERKSAQDALRESESNLRGIFDTIQAGIIYGDSSGNLLMANQHMADMFRYPLAELIGLHYLKLAHPSQAGDARSKLLGLLDGTIDHVFGERLYVRQDGTPFWGQLSAKRLNHPDGSFKALVGIIYDISKRKQAEMERGKLEAQLRQAQKMEAIGTLAGGIAHDFNNLLGVILGYAERAQDHALRGKSMDYDIAQVVNAAQRATQLVQQILTFSRRGQAVMQPISLNLEVGQVIEMLGRTIPKMISIETDLAAGLELINCDVNQIELVLLNLANNAVDAMPEGGRLFIGTRNTELDEAYSHQHPQVKPGRYVLLEVSDTGTGMDEATRQHIFEPFYTTKEVGKGTGLGLSAVYGIVTDHGGHIACYSEPGIGTTMRAYWPVYEGEPAPPRPDEALGEKQLRGTERLLLVDDEDALRNLTAEALEETGYEVFTAGSGEQALEIYRVMKDRLDLVILDLGMPGMGGRKCLKEILALNPRAKVLIASGYAVNGVKDETVNEGASAFVAKPYRLVDMLAMVRSVLDQK